MNATYSGIYDDPITLKDGYYEGEPYGEDDPSRPIVRYIEGQELFSDLDDDGDEDAIVFLLESGGGTASFTYVAAQLNQDGEPLDAGAVMVEDRTQFRAAAIEDGQLILDVTTRGPGDVDCCPSHKIRRTYTLEGGKLVDVTNDDQELVRISGDDLNGTNWKLSEMDGEEVLLETDVTIRFQDGEISGSGGCNTYRSSFTLSDDNPYLITLSPILSTKMACPDPILSQETTYFTALDNVSIWGYSFGQLVFSYMDEQDERSELFFVSQKDN